MTIDTTPEKIDALLARSVKEILPSKEALRELLLSGKKIRIYIGTDATGTSLHLGHATNYILLEKFRQLGHEVIFLIGDFTSRIGDPTDKSATRIQLTREQVVENVKTWLDQVHPVIDFDNTENPVRVVYNNDWLAKLTFEEIISISSHFTVQGMLERDMFEKRLEENKPIYLHEFFYPLMQGYDSVVMDIDIEVCGNDQKFNALAGRMLQKRINNREKFVFITTLLENPKTGEKMMSKSLGTGVFLDATAEDMFGGIMAQPDENMHQLFIDCTFLELPEIEAILHTTDNRANKLRLAEEITTIYHGSTKAHQARANWENTFSKGGLPEDMPEITVTSGTLLVDAVLLAGLVESKNEWRRLVEAGGIKRENDDKVTDALRALGEATLVLKIGKHRFLKIIAQ
jgi:tyrosyl-tRNA synthetase